jgi:hypothetical protein
LKSARWGGVLICAATCAFYFLVGERCVGALGSQQFALFAMTAAGAGVAEILP